MNEQLPIKLSITRIAEHSPTIWSFFMAAQGARPDFIAGQAAELQTDGRTTYIAFASAPADAEFEFLIKRSDSNYVAGRLFEARAAVEVTLENIVGTGFPVERHKGCDLVFAAMGTGLAPLRSALHHVFRTRTDYGRLVVLYGARTMDDFCFEDEMMNDWRAHGVELRQVVSQPDADWSGPTGYVQSLLDHIVPALPNPIALVCGSSKMIEQTRGRLLALGFAPEKILTNY